MRQYLVYILTSFIKLIYIEIEIARMSNLLDTNIDMI